MITNRLNSPGDILLTCENCHECAYTQFEYNIFTVRKLPKTFNGNCDCGFYRVKFAFIFEGE